MRAGLRAGLDAFTRREQADVSLIGVDVLGRSGVKLGSGLAVRRNTRDGRCFGTRSRQFAFQTGHALLYIEPQITSVASYEAHGIDTTGQGIEAAVLNGHQMVGRDFQVTPDNLGSYALSFACFPQIRAECLLRQMTISRYVALIHQIIE